MDITIKTMSGKILSFSGLNEKMTILELKKML